MSPARRTGPIDRFFVNRVTGLNSKEVGYVLKYSVMPGFSLHSLPKNMEEVAALEAEAEKEAQHGDFDVAHSLQSSTNSLRELIGIQNNVFDACLKLRKVACDAKESFIRLKKYDMAGKWAKVDSAVSQLLKDVEIDRMRPWKLARSACTTTSRQDSWQDVANILINWSILMWILVHMHDVD